MGRPLPCVRPTAGWHCHLPAGHDGPCPAWPNNADVAVDADHPYCPRCTAEAAKDRYLTDYLSASARPSAVLGDPPHVRQARRVGNALGYLIAGFALTGAALIVAAAVVAAWRLALNL